MLFCWIKNKLTLGNQYLIKLQTYTPLLNQCDSHPINQLLIVIARCCNIDLGNNVMNNVNSDICTLCNSIVIGDLSHSLLMCNYNGGAGQFLLDKLHHVLPNLLPSQVVLLDLDVDKDKQLPLVYLIASQVWECRKQKKPCHLQTRSWCEHP